MSKKPPRNAACPCGSGRKYKHCCIGKDSDAGTTMKSARLDNKPISLAFTRPPNYVPPSSALELLRRYEKGERYFENSDLREATLRKATLRDANLIGSTLTGADLSGADLRLTNLAAVHLNFANLRDTNLELTYLGDARLAWANFSGARLRSANLGGAYSVLTNFDGSDLTDAVLEGAIIRDPDWRDAVLDRAKFDDTSLVWVDLTVVKNLDRAWHMGPSYVDLGTLRLTAAGIEQRPACRDAVVLFLQGCGVEESDIRYFRSMKPPSFHSTFISYSHRDKAFATRLYDELQSQGVRCWMDDHDMTIGSDILDGVDHAIRASGRVLLCCSRSSLSSRWVSDEIRKALRKEQETGQLILLPLMLDDYMLKEWSSGLTDEIVRRLAADFRSWLDSPEVFSKQMERVVGALRIG